MLKPIEYARCGEEIFRRKDCGSADVSAVVAAILADVRARGDRALCDYARKFDGADLRAADLEVRPAEIDAAVAALDKTMLTTLKNAADNIAEFHRRQLREDFRLTRADGEILGQKIVPLERAGIYVPGGTASYPSTVLMNAIPAKIAGVREIVMVTPPDKNGAIKNSVLAAARLAGVDRIFRIGGAQAIAALAYGTESIPKADKITGPGNVYVAEAKRQVFGQTDIDMIAGPSEILIVADRTANADFVAADMLSQAEHDRNAAAILVTDDAILAENVAERLEARLALLEREEIARASIEQNGKIIVVTDTAQALEIADRFAPEHLELCVAKPFEALASVRNAGSVFLGNYTPEALGDYFAGTNHTLPTGGTARFSSPLSVDDFIKKFTYIYYPKDALGRVGRQIEVFAAEEGLTAHAASVAARTEVK